MHFASISFSLAPRRLRLSLTVAVRARALGADSLPRKSARVTTHQRSAVATGYFNHTLGSEP